MVKHVFLSIKSKSYRKNFMSRITSFVHFPLSYLEKKFGPLSDAEKQEIADFIKSKIPKTPEILEILEIPKPIEPEPEPDDGGIGER
jgi:hypothetical protein